MRQGSVILVTGGSSGIGAAVVERLAGAGMHVWAASRSGRVPGSGARSLNMDVTSEDSIRAALERLLAEEGRLDAVVVNAGNGIAGALEETSAVEAKYQFETNYFGAINTINACLPALKASRGRIVAITSVAAIVPLPYQGMYSASKAALQSAMKTYAMELRPFGVQCSTVLPGDTSTGFTAARKLTEAATSPSSPYRERFARCRATFERDETTGMSPDVIARAVQRQLGRRRMRTTVIPGASYKAVGVLVRLVPDRVLLKVLSMIYNK